MEVKSGYKRTKVGVIPEDWEVGQLGNCLIGTPDYGINAPAVPYADRLPVYIRITDITDDGRFSTENIASVEGAETQRYFLNVGDLVLARTGASVGKSYLYNPDDGKLVFAGFLIRVKPNPTKLDPHFLAAYLTTGSYWSWVKVMSMRSGQPGINSAEYAQLPIPIPSLPEQRAIAAALGDVDALITALDRLIAKKRAIKQGAMQQLLTGETRLPGFGKTPAKYKQTEVGVIPEDWMVKTADEICLKIQDGTHFSPSLGGNDHLYVTSKNIGFGVLDISDAERIDASQHKAIYSRCDVKKGDLLLTKDGVNTGNAALNYLEEEISLLSSVAFLRFDPRQHIAGYYLQQILSPNGQRRIKELMAGNAITRLTLEKIRKICFSVPSFPEQRVIAAILSDMDAEIAALERKRDKTRVLKQGMMQKLLTGEIRLI